MDQVKIGAFIARLRREKNWTQEELGERVGVTNKTVSRWENGNYMPGVEMLTLLGREFGVSLNELVEGRRLEGEDFREAAEQNLAAALEGPRERLRRWLERYGVFAAVTFVLCVMLATVVVMGLQYEREHPRDVSPAGTFMYRPGWPDNLNTKGVLYLSFYYGKYYIFTASGEYLEWGSYTQNGDAVRVGEGETARWLIIKGRQIRDEDPRNGELITYEYLKDVPIFIGIPPDRIL